ncbi:MAG: hypothetical protein NTY09_10410 [bacterium]|nr:hypothetical protein [bacterium]
MYRLTFLILLSLIAPGLISSCHPDHVNSSTDVENPVPYVLPDRHIDNDNPLKLRFFQEAFRDLDGNLVQMNNLRGQTLVICVYSSFMTNDGRKSLLGLESLLALFKDRFLPVFIPLEDKETIQPSIVNAPDNMIFLFRAGSEESNLSLIDRYSSLFWNRDIIAADFPMDKPESHFTSPFYWIVDENGIIREKLIDYSDSRGVEIGEVREVLDALLGPNPPDEPVQESTTIDETSLSVTEPEADVPADENNANGDADG